MYFARLLSPLLDRIGCGMCADRVLLRVPKVNNDDRLRLHDLRSFTGCSLTCLSCIRIL